MAFPVEAEPALVYSYMSGIAPHLDLSLLHYKAPYQVSLVFNTLTDIFPCSSNSPMKIGIRYSAFRGLPGTSFAYVLFIEFYDFFEVCDVASSAYLPHSGKSRLGCEAGAVMKFVFIPFIYCWRAGTD